MLIKALVLNLTLRREHASQCNDDRTCADVFRVSKLCCNNCNTCWSAPMPFLSTVEFEKRYHLKLKVRAMVTTTLALATPQTKVRITFIVSTTATVT